MTHLFIPISLLLAVTSTLAYNCPPTGTFYHADPHSGCQVYHHCENSVMTTFQCPDGEIFNHHEMKCANASTSHCEETMAHHHMHKRSAGEGAETTQVHTIAIDELKQGARVFYETVKEAAKDALKEVAPSLHERLSEEYNKTSKAIKEDVLPILKERIIPRAKQAYEYSKTMGVRVFNKVYKSYRLSNETHISIVSFKDILEDLAKDLKPYMNFGRYLSSRLGNGNTRTKREAESDPSVIVPDVMATIMHPVVRYVASYVGGMVTGTEDTITSKIVVPILSEMYQDPETSFNMRRIFWSTKAAIAPFINEMMSKQTHHTPEGTVIQVPQSSIDAVRTKLYDETSPIVEKVLEKHLPTIFMKLSQNVPLVMKSLARFKASSGPHFGVLQDSILRFISKHGPLVTSSSNGGHRNSYTYSEIQDDLRPIKVTLLQILVDYFSNTPGSLLNAAFNRNSDFYRVFIGKEIYARPSEDFYKSQKGLSSKYRSFKQHS